MDKKEVTPEQLNEFFNLLGERHPDIDMQLPATRVLLNGSIVCNQPAKMPNDEYDIYFRFLRRWYMDNYFILFEPDRVYVSTIDSKAIEIDTSTIISIEPIDMELSKITIQQKESDIKDIIIIKESAEYFKRRTDIF